MKRFHIVRIFEFGIISIMLPFLFSFHFAPAQTILNGDFENNTAGSDHINNSNATFNSLMANSHAFGSNGNMDIIKSTLYCGLAESNTWYVAFTGGGTDAISLTLSAPLVSGNTYTVSFYDRACSITAFPFQFGLSTVNDLFGTAIYTEPVSPVNNVWTGHGFTFVAPNNGQYLTIQMGGALADWGQMDNVELAPGNDLPVHMLSFTATKGVHEVQLQWNTASEINNHYFTLFRASDKINYEIIGTVDGAGNSTSPVDYHFNDREPLPGVALYKLQQTDYDGKSAFYGPVAVNFSESPLQVYPAISHGVYTIIGLQSGVEVMVFTIQGKEVFHFVATVQSSSNPVVVDLSDLPAGMYFISIPLSEGYFQKKIIRE